jgi:undecaprenyl-diphosphatase
MTWWQALVLGIVEGLTEYLPVSSTGHLILAQRVMGIGQSEAADAYAICIQAGAIIAVVGLYWRRFKQMAGGLIGRDQAGFRLARNLVIAFSVTAVVALSLEKQIKSQLFGLWPVVTAWIVGGCAILIMSQYRGGRRRMFDQGVGVDDVTWQQAAIIGTIQTIAMWPGTSRSLVTIVGGVAVGMGLGAAVEFSFLLGVLTLTAATVHDFYKHGHAMTTQLGGWPVLAIGTVAAAISAALAVRWMVGYLKQHGLAVFGWYRITIGVGVAVLILIGLLREEPKPSGQPSPAPQITAPAAP